MPAGGEPLQIYISPRNNGYRERENRTMIRKTLLVLVIFFVLLSGCMSEPVPKTGTVQFSSSPPGAQIYLDSQFRGSTPSSVADIVPGNHTLEFRYPGYESWSAVMVISPGQNNVFAALLQKPVTTGQESVVTSTITTASPVYLTIQAGRDRMVIGDSVEFSGRAVGCKQVLLTIYGPGSYVNGVSLTQANVNDIGVWSYTWNPGSKLQAGTYTMVVNDPWKTASERAEVTVTGGGEVSITSNSFSAAKGSTVQFSGRCTTGSPNVNLVLYGPEQYSGGVDLGTFSVDANKNWNFKYTLDSAMPTGTYTMYVYDIPKTGSSTVQFTVGFA
jgi:hypothetical protein